MIRLPRSLMPVWLGMLLVCSHGLRNNSALAQVTKTDDRDILVHRVDYTVRLAQGGVRVKADFDIELTGREPTSLPWLAGVMAVEPGSLPSGLRLVQDGESYRLLVSRRRRTRFSLTFTTRVTRDALWRETRFTGPAKAAITALDISGPGDNTDIQLKGGVVETAGTAKGESFLRGFLGATPAVHMRWRDKADEAARQTLLACTTLATAQITPAVIKCKTAFNYEIVQGAVQQLQIDLPTGHALTRLEGDAIRDWHVAPIDEAWSRLSVDFIAARDDQVQLTLFTEQSLDALPTQVPWRLPRPHGVERENGLLHLMAVDVIVEPGEPGTLRQVSAPPDALAAYRFHERPVALPLRLRHVDPTVHVDNRVRLHIDETQVSATHRLTLSVEKAGLYSATLAPMDSWRIASVRGPLVKDWQTENGRLHITFTRRLLGQASIEIKLEQDIAHPARHVNLAALRFVDAERETTHIGVASALGMRVRTQDLTGLREIPVPSRTRPEDEQLGFRAERSDWTLALSLEPMTPRVLADIFNLVAIGDGVAGGSASIRYAIINQGIQELRVRVPDSWKNIDFIGGNIRRKDKTDTGWTLTLQDKVWGGYTLVATYDMAFDPQGADLNLGGIHALDVERETGVIAVSAAPSLKLTEKTVTAHAPAQLFRIDESDLAASDRALITRPILLAYRYSGQDYTLTVDTTRFVQAPGLDAVADLAQVATVLTPDGQLLTQASFMLKNQEKAFQRFRLPDAAEFWSCHAGGEAVKPARDGDDILVPLPREPGRDQAYPVEIVYAEKIGRLHSTPARRLRLTAPGTDVQTTFARWEVYVPATHLLTRFGGSMAVAQGTRYSLRDAWNQCMRFYDSLYIALRGVAIGLLVIGACLALFVLAVRRRWQGLMVLLALGFIAVVLGGMLLPAISSARERARRSSAMSSLSSLGKTLIMYSMDRDGRLPGSVDELIQLGLISDRVLTDPVSGQPFIYVAGGRQSDTLPADAIVAYSPPSGGGRNVLHNDGSVQWMNETDFAAGLARLAQAPAAPRPPSPVTKTPPSPAASESLLKTLDEIVIPEIDFRQAHIADVISFLASSAQAFDAKSADPVNIVLNLGPEVAEWDPFASDPFAADQGSVVESRVPKITFSARHITLREALKISTQIAGLKYRLENGVIMVVPMDAPDGEIIQRAYDVGPAFSDSFIQVHNSLRVASPQGTLMDDGHAGHVDVKAVFRQMGVRWPTGSSVRYVPSLGKLMVANTEGNLGRLDEVVALLSGQDKPTEATPEADSGAPKIAGIRSLRIDVPRSGNRYEFTKVLDVRGEPLTVQATAVRSTTLSVVQGTALLAAFLAGLILAWVGLHAKQRGGLLLALGLVLISGSVVALLLVARLLGAALIAMPPLVLVIGVREAWRRRTRPTPPPLPKKPTSAPPSPTAGAGGVIALLAAISLGLTSSVQADGARFDVQSVRIEGAVRGDVATLNARFEVEADAVDRSQGIRLPLLGEEAALTSFRSSSRHVELVRDGRQLTAHAARDSHARLETDFLVRVGGDVARRTLSFAVPPALSCRLDIMLPEPDARVEAPSAVTLHSTSEGRRTRVEALFGPTDTVDLIWQPRIKRAAETAATVFCTTRATVNVGGGVVNTRTELTYQVTQGEISETRIAVPDDQRVLRVDGAGLRDWSMQTEHGRTVVVAAWSPSVSTEVRLTVETERSLGPLPADVDHHVPYALDVQRETGWIAFFPSEETELGIRSAEGFHKAEADDFIKESRSTATHQRPSSVYRFFTPGRPLGVRIERLEPDITALIVNAVRLDYDQLALTARAAFTIKRAGIFVLRFRLPDDFKVTAVTGTAVARWDVTAEGQERTLVVRLAERTLGTSSLDVHLYRWLPEMPERVDVAGLEALDADTLSGYVVVDTAMGLQANVLAFEGLNEIPAAAVPNAPPGGTLAYRFARDRDPTTPWSLALAPDLVAPWIRAETVSVLYMSAGELGLAQGRATVQFDVQNAPVKDFVLRVPPSFRNVDIVGDNIRRRDEHDGEWRLELQRRVAGAVRFHVSWDQDYDLALPLAVQSVQTPGVERATGIVGLLAAPPLQVATAETEGDLVRMDARDVPAWADWSEREAGAMVWRAMRPGWTLTAHVQHYRDAEALSAMIDSARLVTTLAEDGQALTEMTLAIRHVGRQYLEVALPKGSQLWTAFVDGQAVRPSMRAGRLLFPLEGRRDRANRIEVVFAGEIPFPRRRGTITLDSPSFDAPVKDAAWDLYLPMDYEYSRFGGSMTHAPDAAGQQRTWAFSMGDYLEAEGMRKAARMAQMDARIEAAEKKLQRRELKDVSLMYQEIRQSEPAADASRQHRMRKLEGDLKRAQASNVLESQRSFLALNLRGDTSVIAGATFDPQARGRQTKDVHIAAMQYERLHQAQELALTQVRPLHVALPRRGLRYGFVQALQTEAGRPMTVSLRVANARGIAPHLALIGGSVGFLLLWAVCSIAVYHYRERKATGKP